MQQKYQAGGLFLICHFPVQLVLGGSGWSLCMEEVVALYNFQKFKKKSPYLQDFFPLPILGLASTVTAQKHPGALMFIVRALSILTILYKPYYLPTSQNVCSALLVGQAGTTHSVSGDPLNSDPYASPCA